MKADLGKRLLTAIDKVGYGEVLYDLYSELPKDNKDFITNFDFDTFTQDCVKFTC